MERKVTVHIDTPHGSVHRRTIKLPKGGTDNLHRYLHYRMTRIFGRISSVLQWHNPDEPCWYCRHYPPYH